MQTRAIGMLVRHQLGALIATLVDFALMIALVAGFGAMPAVATASGAAAGAATNFVLGRRWIFRATRMGPAPQALRYALVSLASLLLNSAGEHLLVTVVHLNYILARVIIAATVSVGWNFPMHRYFVFRYGSVRGAKHPRGS